MNCKYNTPVTSLVEQNIEFFEVDNINKNNEIYNVVYKI